MASPGVHPGPAADVLPPRAAVGDSQWALAVREFRKNRLAVVGLVGLAVLYLVALLAPFLAPYDPIAQPDILHTSYLAPSLAHWFGTDRFGRDVLSRMLYGARISLIIAFVAVAISVSIGTLVGAVAGYFGGRVDALLMRFTDMVLAFPRLVLLIMIVALFSPSTPLIIAVLGLTQWPGTARIVRGDVLSLRERDFVQAARALGMSRRRIILRHLVPNVLAPVIVTATLGIGNTIVLEAGLSFLGLGVQPPTPSWGNMVADGRQNLLGAWWVATMPGLAIVFTVLAFNLVGDGLRDALDPRLRR
jgi:peptide/nickel transport system permease protein